MAAYLERYLNGEYEQVWAELLAFGDQVQQEPLHTDAVAVTRETMTRAKYNVELLYQHLTNWGYYFQFQDMSLIPPSDKIKESIAQLESEVGAIPLSLKAWYEIVGGVDFCGYYPRLSSCSDHLTDTEKGIMSDPLFVHSLDTLFEYDLYSDNEVEICPDIFHKSGYSGGASYAIRPNNAAIDGPLLYEWHNTTFVNYLRISFRWGGFPGFDSDAWPLPYKQYREQHMLPPHDLIAALMHGLKPI